MISASEARRQYDRAKRLGWIPLFAKAAASRPWCTTADLMGIGSRETNLDPRYLTHPGDHGNGFSIMQIDKRYFPDWVATGGWRDAEQSIEKGAQVLTQKRAEIIKSLGHVKTWRTSKGTPMRFTGAPFTDAQLHRISIAAYNAGIAAYHHFSIARDPDKGTTGKDYSRDVLARSALFDHLLKTDGVTAPTAPLPAPAEPDAPVAASIATKATLIGGGAVAATGGVAVATSGADIPWIVWAVVGVIVSGVVAVALLWWLSKEKS